MAIIDELISRLGFELDGKEDLREFKRGLRDAEKGAKGFATSVTQMARNVTLGIGASVAAVKGLTAGMFALADAAARPLDNLVNLSARTGESVEAIQEWSFAAQQSGSSAAEMQASIETMNRRIAQAARGTGAAKNALDDFGISATDAEGNIRRATDVMGELAGRFDDLDQGQRLDIARALGISMSMVNVLSQGNDELERLRQVARDAGLVFTREDTEAAAAYVGAMDMLMISVRGLRDRIAIDMLPTLMQMVGGMQEWFNANREVIQQNVGALMERFARHAQTLNARLRELPDAGWKVYAVLAALTRILFPKLFILGLVAGVMDDFLTYLEGGESIIGDFVDGLQDMLGVSEGVAEVMTGVVAALTALAVIKPAAFLRMVGGLWRLSGATAVLKALGAGALLSSVATGVKALSAAALLGSIKLWPYIAAITALVAAFRALKEVIPGTKLPDTDPFEGIEIPEGWKPVNPGSIPQQEQRAPTSPFDARPEFSPQSSAPPASMGTQGPETFAERFGHMTDNRDQSTRVDVGGITLNTQATNGDQLVNEMADALQRRGATIAGERPVSP